jgi:hypothetical protein
MVIIIGEAAGMNTVQVTGLHRVRIIHMHRVPGNIVAMDITGKEAAGIDKSGNRIMKQIANPKFSASLINK